MEPPGAEAQASRRRGRASNGSPKSDHTHAHCGSVQENPERRAQKRPCSSADVKGSASASDQGTLNAMAQDSCQLSAPVISLKEAADVVVRYLTPLYKEGKFASKVG